MPMDGKLPIVVKGEDIHLLPERALWWPARRILLIADIHFGKAATFRALGQPIPAGTTAGNLTRLDRLLQALPAQRLIFLGDFLHGREARTLGLFNHLLQWRQAWPRLCCQLVRGNHDRRAGDPPGELAMEVIDEPLTEGPFALCHEPQALEDRYVMAGHVHPATVLRGRGKERLSLPCFCFGKRIALLPAFGEFTGTWPVEALPGQRIYAVGDGHVWSVGEQT